MRMMKAIILVLLLSTAGSAYYTTSGKDIIDRTSGEVVQLRGIGLGGWLLPEGYMWGIRVLDRPYQFEAAIVDLIGERNARKFWHLYRTNFVTKQDIIDMKSWGINTVRVPLLASMLQPREGQPEQAPFIYDEKAFSYLDDLIEWCEAEQMGVIWDLHGAPGAQNAENISDSDGEARLWTEKQIYWPRTIDLWRQITERYAEKECIVGYDLLNEPLLARYPGVEPGLLRELYVLITQEIRKTDADGIIFVEGDDWAQDFSILEPLDWDPHLVIGFHSYPPSSTKHGIRRWDELRDRYNIPLWHGETGEQNPPWELYRRSTTFLADENIGWNWWTHKKFELSRQPWSIPRTEGFNKILDYWKGDGPRPSRREAKRWLFDQARKTNTKYCDFLPDMVRSLYPLDPSDQIERMGNQVPVIRGEPKDIQYQQGFGAILQVKAMGYPLEYQWYRNDQPILDATEFFLAVHALPEKQRQGEFYVTISNELATVQSRVTSVEMLPFRGLHAQKTEVAPAIDGQIEALWANYPQNMLTRVISGDRSSEDDLGGWYSVTWDTNHLFFLLRVKDDLLSDNASVNYMKDGIEIYLDGDNSKSSYYGQDEFQIRVVEGDSLAQVDIGRPIEGIVSAQRRFADGYCVEVSVPWKAVSSSSEIPKYLGLDIHINDNDGSTRNGKLAWWAERDNSYQTPYVFGVIRLK